LPLPSIAVRVAVAPARRERGPLTVLRKPAETQPHLAAAVGLRASLPLKITSSILSPRRLLALCSPITQVMASATLLLPHPLGPTIAVTPLSKASSERSEKRFEAVDFQTFKTHGTPTSREMRIAPFDGLRAA
jgi:hypothetical protein